VHLCRIKLAELPGIWLTANERLYMISTQQLESRHGHGAGGESRAADSEW
jgi:hypothetical protein